MNGPSKQRQKKKASVLVQAPKKLHNDILERISDGFLALDKNWRITYINKKAGEIFRCDPHQVVGKHIWTEFPEDIDQPIYKDCHSAVAEQKYICTEEHGVRDGIWLERRIYPSPEGLSICFRDITARKKSEETVLKAYTEKETVLNRISDSVVSVDNEWRYTFLNDAALATHAASRKETLGKVIWDVHPEMEGTVFWDKYHEAMQTRQVVEIESYYAPMNIWFSVKVYPSQDGLTILYKDVTKRKIEEDKVKDSELFYRSIIEQASEAIFIANDLGEYIDVNTSACKLLGYTREELLSKTAKDVVFTEDQVRRLPERYEMLKGGKSDIAENKLKRKDGTPVDVEVNAKMLADGRFVGIVRDITERKKGERKLSQTLKELIDYKFALDEASIVAITDQKGVIKYVNDNFRNISKYSQEELVGQDHRIINSGYHPKAFIKNLWTTIAHGKIWRGELCNKAKNGTIYWVDTTIIPFLNEESKPYQYVAIKADITERKKAEEKLVANEQRFRVLIENMSDAIVLNDEHSNLLYQSPAVTRILGYTWEERRGKRVLDYVHPDNRDDYIALYKNLNEQPGRPHPFQYRFLHKKGHYVWLEGVVTNLLHEPSVKAIVANYRDIGDRKEAEEKLQRERTLLRTLIDNIPDYVYVKDTESRFLINNKANLNLMGRATEEETIGKTAADIFGVEIARPYTEDDQQLFQSGMPVVDREEAIKNSIGESKFLLTTKVPLRDSQNNVIGLVGISRDITKQKQVEAELRNSNFFLESAQHVGKIGHWISEIGQSDKLIWSAETCRIFGLIPEEFDGRNDTFLSFVHPEDLDLVKSATSAAIETDQAYSIDHRIVLRDGTIKWVHEQGKATMDQRGQAVLLVGIVQDITDRKESENEILKLNAGLEERVKLRTEQLQDANKEMEAFTYSVSHDLRSPLRIIDGFAQMLTEDYASKLGVDGQQTLGVIMSNAKKMGQLIDDLLDFSRIGRVEIRKIKVDMNRTVKEIFHELQLSGIVIPKQLRIADLKPAACDPNLIKHVWINLLSNAIKYSSGTENPVIEVGMQKDSNKLIYYVKDNGAGFDMRYYHKLFGVFQRLHSHNEFSGTGVGLALVHRIIVRHGGSIWAESIVNEGATFYFSLE